jgi:hypothetical protein
MTMLEQFRNSPTVSLYEVEALERQIRMNASRLIELNEDIQAIKAKVTPKASKYTMPIRNSRQHSMRSIKRI